MSDVIVQTKEQIREMASQAEVVSQFLGSIRVLGASVRQQEVLVRITEHMARIALLLETEFQA